MGAKLTSEEQELVSNVEQMMGALKDKDLTEEERTLFDGLRGMIAELRRMDAGGEEEQEPEEDELTPEERVLVKNLLDDVAELPGGRELIRGAAGNGGRVTKELEFRTGTRYGAPAYDSPRRNTGEPADSTDRIGAQLHDMRDALAQQADVIRQLLKGLQVADGAVDAFSFGQAARMPGSYDTEDRPLGPGPDARRWAAHKADREADELAGLTDEELRRRPSRHELGQVQKSQELAELTDALIAAVAKMGGASSSAGKSGAEVTRDVAKELLVNTFTPGAADPRRTW